MEAIEILPFCCRSAGKVLLIFPIEMQMPVELREHQSPTNSLKNETLVARRTSQEIVDTSSPQELACLLRCCLYSFTGNRCTSSG